MTNDKLEIQVYFCGSDIYCDEFFLAHAIVVIQWTFRPRFGKEPSHHFPSLTLSVGWFPILTLAVGWFLILTHGTPSLSVMLHFISLGHTTFPDVAISSICPRLFYALLRDNIDHWIGPPALFSGFPEAL